MAQVTGIVEFVDSKKTSNPKFTLHFMTVDGVKYGTKFDRPNVAPGDYIKFSYKEEEYQGYQNKIVNAKYITVLPPEEAPARPAPAEKSSGVLAGNKGNVKDAYWEEKAQRDIDADLTRRWNAARSTAVSVLDLAAKCGVPIAVEGKKGAPDLDVVIKHVDSLTESLFISGSNVDYMNAILDVGLAAEGAIDVNIEEGAYDEDV